MRWGKAIAALLVFALCLTIAGCEREHEAIETSSVQADAGAVVSVAAGGGLTFRITWKGYSGRGEAIQAIVDAYNRESGDAAHVKLVNGDEDLSTIEALLQGAPETVYVLPYRFVKYFGDKGYLADLTEAFADEKDFFFQRSMDAWRRGRKDIRDSVAGPFDVPALQQGPIGESRRPGGVHFGYGRLFGGDPREIGRAHV